MSENGPFFSQKCLLVLAMLAGVGCTTTQVTENSSAVWDPVLTGQSVPPPLVDLSAFASQDRRPSQNGNLSFAVAISGGGLRAANFALGVLMALEDLPRSDGTRANFLKEIDYFSTVSGGGFAAGAYLAALHDHAARGGTLDTFSLTAQYYRSTEQGDRALRRRFQILGDNIFTESAIQSVTSLFKSESPGRGDVFQDRLDALALNADGRTTPTGGGPAGRSLKLGSIFVPDDPSHSATPLFPYHFANATLFGNGSIFTFAPDVLRRFRICGYMYRGQPVFLEKDYEMPLAVGVRASATFPIAFPATTLIAGKKGGTLRYVHLLDGGLADNLGVTTAIDLLRQIPASKGESRRKVLLVIDAFKEATDAYYVKSDTPGEAETLMRITDIGLDSWRGRYKQQIAALCAKENVIPMFIDFDLLEQGDLKDIAEKGSGVGHGETTLRRLAEGARQVQTSLSVSEQEQQILVEAGRRIIERYQKDIAAILQPQSGSPASHMQSRVF